MIGVAILLFLILSFLVHIVIRLQRLEGESHDAKVEHAMCIAHVSHYVGNHFAADVLKAAAEAYNQPSTQSELQIIARRQPGTGSLIPAIWLTNRANALIEEVENHD